MIYILFAQYGLGIIQLIGAVSISLFKLYHYRNIHKTLKNYWLLVIGYFTILFLLFLINENLGMPFLFFAWAIAVYWFVKIKSWIKYKGEEH